MRIIINKIIYTVGIITLMLLAYTLCFYVAAFKIVYPYEYDNSFESHPIRPIYNVIFYPLRWVKANGMSLNSNGVKEYYGWVIPDSVTHKIDMRYAKVNGFDGPIVSIGFTGDEDLLEEFDKIEQDQYVMLAFSVALDKNGDRFINKLISYKKINLPPDPRIKPDNESKQESEQLRERYNNHTGEAKKCAEEFIKNYQQKVLEHCLLAGYANNIGGGCYHIVGYSVNTGVLKKALNECKVET